MESNDPVRPSIPIPVRAFVSNESPTTSSESLESVLFGRQECAKCHADPAKGLVGADLYQAVCKMCHGDISPYASSKKVASLSVGALRGWIADGKNEEGMPGFSTKLRGPLSEGQIDSLVNALVGAR